MKKTLCIILCLITLNSLSGCGNKKEYATGGESLTAIEFKEQEQSPKIKISAVECDSFIRAYADINAEQYPYSELFGISAAMSKMQESRNLIGEHQYSFFKADKTVSADRLLEIVKENNAEYREDTVKKNMTKEFSDKQLKTYCGWIAETVNWQIEKITGFDFETIGCVLGNLKIVEKNSTNYGGFDCKNGVMSINPKMIKATGKKNDYEKFIFTHEAIHMLQSGCADMTGEDSENYGVSYSFSELLVNPLKLSWLYEGSAELNAAQFRNTDISTYKAFVAFIKSLDLATLVNDTPNSGMAENICFGHNPEDLYRELGFENEQTAAAFLYSAEIMLTKPDDFFKAYGNESEDKTEFVNRNIKPAVYETLSKMFYRNIAKRLCSTEMSLNDVFCLISLHEAQINKQLQFGSKESQEIYKSYIDEYAKIKEKFFELVGAGNAENISGKYGEYKLKYADNGDYINADFGWLDENKRDIIKSIIGI